MSMGPASEKPTLEYACWSSSAQEKVKERAARKGKEDDGNKKMDIAQKGRAKAEKARTFPGH